MADSIITPGDFFHEFVQLMADEVEYDVTPIREPFEVNGADWTTFMLGRPKRRPGERHEHGFLGRLARKFGYKEDRGEVVAGYHWADQVWVRFTSERPHKWETKIDVLIQHENVRREDWILAEASDLCDHNVPLRVGIFYPRPGDAESIVAHIGDMIKHRDQCPNPRAKYLVIFGACPDVRPTTEIQWTGYAFGFAPGDGWPARLVEPPVTFEPATERAARLPSPH